MTGGRRVTWSFVETQNIASFLVVQSDSFKVITMPCRITICCCCKLFGEGVKRLIKEGDPEINCTVNVCNPKEVIQKNPDILIIDFNTLSAISIVTLLKRKIGILLLWTSCFPSLTDENLLGFISQGLIGVLSPESGSSELKKAIQRVASGELWFNRKKLKDLITCVNNGHREFDVRFNGKEKEIVQSICKGYSNKEIVKHFNISEPSVKKYLNSIYKKIGVTDRLQLALYAMKHWPFYFKVT